MKQLTCEMCGSTDLLKQDGVFVCQSCGCKYSIEEARKMMIEGTVKIDNSDKLKNYYELARQAKESNDAENAVKYYDLIKQEDPGSWEASFYNVYFRAIQTRIMFIESAAYSVRNCLDTVFDLIKNNDDDIEIKKLQAGEVALRVAMICTLLESSAKNSFVDTWNRNYGKGGGSLLEDSSLEYAKRVLASVDARLRCGNLIERDYSSYKTMSELACTCWKQALDVWKNIYSLFEDHADRYAKMRVYISKIQKYEPNYICSAPLYPGLPNVFARILKEGSDKDFGVSCSSSSSSGGCYVATAVYGSYDCPQVWTLRRFRDYTLAVTWYGRAFIHTYYAISPTLVKWFGHTAWFKKMWKGTLDRMVASLNSSGVEDTPYEDRSW